MGQCGGPGRLMYGLWPRRFLASRSFGCSCSLGSRLGSRPSRAMRARCEGRFSSPTPRPTPKTPGPVKMMSLTLPRSSALNEWTLLGPCKAECSSEATRLLGWERMAVESFGPWKNLGGQETAKITGRLPQPTMSFLRWQTRPTSGANSKFDAPLEMGDPAGGLPK